MPLLGIDDFGLLSSEAATEAKSKMDRIRDGEEGWASHRLAVNYAFANCVVSDIS